MYFLCEARITRIKHYDFYSVLFSNKLNFKFALRKKNIIIRYYQTFT